MKNPEYKPYDSAGNKYGELTNPPLASNEDTRVWCQCELMPPHLLSEHQKLADALEANPNQLRVGKDGIIYLVDYDDFIKELNNDNE